MNLGDSRHRFGICWLIFGYTLALHVLDEAAHDFLSVYLPNAVAIRRAAPYLPIPLFTFQSWIASLTIALAIFLALTPWALSRQRWLRRVAVPIALIAGLLNGAAHIISSIVMGRMMPGVYSAPLLLISGTLLVRSGLQKVDDRGSSGVA